MGSVKGDLQITYRVKEALGSQVSEHLVGLADLDIRVNTKNGVVTLDGVVDSLADRQHAETVAGEIDGVKQVQNNLVIATERVADDDDLADAVSQRLVTRNDEYRKVGVVSHKGVIHLYGDVDNLGQEQDILTIAMENQGVREVISHLKFPNNKHGERIDDATVRNNVHFMLSTHSDVDRGDILVTTHRGRVLLRGTVESLEDKQIAGKLAAMAEGVRSVKNELHSYQGDTGGDERLAAMIRQELGRDDRVSPAQVKVYVENGAIFLDGEVDSPQAKEAASEVIQTMLPELGRIKGFHNGIMVSAEKGSVQKRHEEREPVLY